MLTLLSALGVLNVIACLAVIFYTYLFRGAPLVSWRNIFLLGYLFFFGSAVALAAPYEFPSDIYHPTGKGYPVLAVSIPMFLILFLISYNVVSKWDWTLRLVPNIKLPITSGGVMIAIVSMFSIVLISIPLGGGSIEASYVFFIRSALGAGSAGLALFLLLSKPRSPIYWAMFLFILLTAMVVSTMGSIDRRNLLSVFFVVGWIWYYASLRFQRPAKVIRKLAVVAFGAFFILAVYNTFRQKGDAWQVNNFAQRAQQFQSTSASSAFTRANLIDSLVRQDTPCNTLAIIETYPDPFPHYPFHGIYFLVVNPIPRMFWPGKPEGIAIVLQRQLNSQANLGPGIIGHGWLEAGWIGILYYAIGMGFIIAVIDNAVRVRANNPYFLVAIGCSLGNVLGFARGETALFAALIVGGFFGTVIILNIVGKIFAPYFLLGSSLIPVEEQVHSEHDDDHHEHGSDEYGEGEDHHHSEHDPYAPTAA